MFSVCVCVFYASIFADNQIFVHPSLCPNENAPCMKLDLQALPLNVSRKLTSGRISSPNDNETQQNRAFNVHHATFYFVFACFQRGLLAALLSCIKMAVFNSYNTLT